MSATLSNKTHATATQCPACVILFKDGPPPQPAAGMDSSNQSPTPNADPYSTLLASAGYSIRYIPVLCTTDLPEALDPILDLNAPPPEAFIVTSVRAARVFAAAAKLVASKSATLTTATVWTVGKATAQPLVSLPGITVLGTDAGNAQELTDQILAHYHHDGAPPPPPPPPLSSVKNQQRAMVVLRGDKSLDIVPTRLRAAGFNVMEVQVYATSPRVLDMAEIVHNNNTNTNKDEPPWWVFFSPSGVDIVRNAVATDGIELRQDRVKIAAIGQTTAQYLTSEQVGWWVDAVAGRPTAEGLVEAIVEHDRNGRVA